MSFLSLDLSRHSAQPVELYRFTFSTNRWLYTDSDEDVAWQGETYRPTPITRGETGVGQELSRSALAVTVPRDNAVAGLYIGPPPDAVVSLTIYAFHKGDTDAEVVVIWQGRVQGVSFDGVEAEITCEPIFTSMRCPGLRGTYQTLCRHELFGAACGVQSEANKLATTVASVSGVSVTVPGPLASGWARGGMLETARGARRWVLAQSGNVLTLDNRIPDLLVGEAVTLYAGCDQAFATCRDKFSNHLNFGGFPFMPTKNPFMGDPIM